MRRTAVAALGALGLVLIVTGTFLPWLRSGSAERNSYQAGGALKRLFDVRGLPAAGLDVWPFIGLLCAGVVVLYVAGLPRVAAALGVLCGAAAAAVSIGTLTAHGGTFAQPLDSGPGVTVAGSVFLLGASTVCLLPQMIT